MQYVELLTILATIVGLFMWNRSESRNDWRMANALSREDWRMANALIQSIKDEMKDLHGRLCAIEERRKLREGE